MERSGGSLLWCRRLLRAFPDARVIHVFRDGREAALSMSRHTPFRFMLAIRNQLKPLGLDPTFWAGSASGPVVALLDGLADRLVRPARLQLDKVPLSDFAWFWSHRRAGIWSRGEFRVVDQRDALRTLRTLLSFKLLPPRALWQFVRLGLKLRRHAANLSFADPSRALALDEDASIADWIRTHAGPESVEGLAGASIPVLTLAEPEEVGVAYGMALLWGFVFEPAEFLTPERGMGQFAQALVDVAGDRIRLSAKVERIVVRDGAIAGVQTGNGFVAADAVVCATTATEARRLLPDLPRGIDRALGLVTYSSNCRVVFGVDRQVLPDQCYFVALPRREGSFLADYSDAAVKSPQVASALPGGLIHAESASEWAGFLSALPDADLRQRFLAEIRRYSPDMPEPRFARVYRWKEAVCLMPGGALTAIFRALGRLPEQVRGLALAGEYTHMPSVNGAAASGIAAVEGLLGNASSPSGPQTPVRPRNRL